MKAGGLSRWTLTGLQERAHLRERYNDEEGPVDALMLHEVCDERDGLDGLSQTHLIGEDTVQVVVVQGHQPLQTLDLQAQRWPALKPGSGSGAFPALQRLVHTSHQPPTAIFI